MPTIHGPLDADGLAIVEVILGPASPQNARLLQSGQLPIPAVQVPAIIDVGASISCVDPAIAQQVCTGPSSVRPISGFGAAAPVQCNTYNMALAVPHPATVPGASQSLVISVLAMVAGDVQHQSAKVLLGTDVLEQCRFLYDGPNRSFELIY
jgi:hypothetical protein